MITEEISYLDSEFDVNEQVPTTLQELVEVLGSEEAVIAAAVADTRYRNKYPRVYGKVAKEVEANFPRNVVKEETKADGTVKKVMESDNNLLRRFLSGGDENRARLQELFTQYGQSEPLYVKGERTGGGGKVSAAAMEAANSVLAKGNEEQVVSHIENTVPGYKVSRTAEGVITPESLARGISTLQKHLMKNALANIPGA